MLTVIIDTKQGQFKEKLQEGEPVLKAAWRVGLDEHGLGMCGGNCCCATCHMQVVSGGEHVSAMAGDENALLDTQPDADDASRLACQMKVQSSGELHVIWREDDDE